MYRDFDCASVEFNRFDVVTLLDVLEHVVDPGDLINACHRILRPGGLIHLHTPVVTRIDRFMHRLLALHGLERIGHAWQSSRTSIFHLTNFTPRVLGALLEDAGFGDVRIEVRNELSWPVTRYIRVWVLRRLGLPGLLAPLLYPIFYPLVATNFFNSNKAIASAICRKAEDARNRSGPDASLR